MFGRESNLGVINFCVIYVNFRYSTLCIYIYIFSFPLEDLTRNSEIKLDFLVSEVHLVFTTP